LEQMQGRPMKQQSLTPVLSDGNALILAYDHGIEHGPRDFQKVPEASDPQYIIDLARHNAVSGLAVQKGVAENVPTDLDAGLIVKCNGKEGMREGVPYSPPTCSVSYAAELGADAIGYTLYPGSDASPRMVREFRSVQEAARDHDLPVIVWAYPRGDPIPDDQAPDVVAYGGRIARELGADMVKLKWPGSQQAMDAVVDAAGNMDVVLSGGAKDSEFVETVRSCMAAGCTGLAVGRNVWKRENPREMLDELSSVIYRG